MKLKTFVIGGAFVVALGLGLILGLRWFSHQQPTVTEFSADTSTETDQLVKSVDGTIRTFSADIPSIWTLDPETIPSSAISFEVTAETEIITNGAAPRVGTWTRVELVNLTAPVLLAKSIVFQPSPPPISVEDALSLVSSTVPGTWAISNYPFLVDSTTRIVTNGLTAEPGVWARVEMVKLSPEVPGSARRRATAIELLRARSDPGPNDEIVDRVREIDGAVGLWLVGGVQVLISPETVRDPSIVIDDVVLVRGHRSSEGLLADTIARLPAGQEVFFDGVIRNMNGEEWQVEVDSAQLVMVDITNSSVEGQPGTNREVSVHGIELQEGVVHAIRVWISDEVTVFELVGWLRSIDASSSNALWNVRIVDGPALQSAYVAIDDDTQIDEGQANVTPNAWLEITARREQADIYRAERVKVLPHPPKRSLKGVVQQAPGGARTGEWIVDQYRVIVTSNTAVTGNPGQGSFVEVSGQLDYEGAIVAEVIGAIAP